MLLDKELILIDLNKVTIKDAINGCWLYPTTEKSPYGYYKSYRVNRLSAWIFLGLDLDDLSIFALHKVVCKNKNCWNPDHLYLGDESNNTLDTIKAGTHFNKNKTFCKNRHEFTLQNTYYIKRYIKGVEKSYRICRICKNNSALRSFHENKKAS